MAKEDLSMMMLNSTSVSNSVATMMGFFEPEYLIKRVDYLASHVVPSLSQGPAIQTPDRPRMPQGARKRVRWTPEEDQVLIQGKELDQHPWVAIAQKLPNRSNVDCKDRYRSILKARSRQRHD